MIGYNLRNRVSVKDEGRRESDQALTPWGHPAQTQYRQIESVISGQQHLGPLETPLSLPKDEGLICNQVCRRNAPGASCCSTDIRALRTIIIMIIM